MTLRTAFCLALLLAFGAGSLHADVLTTTDGLVLEGEVEKLPNGWDRVRTAQGEVELAPEAVAAVKKGANPRAELTKAAKATKAEDAVGFYRLALRAEEAGLVDLRRSYLERVLKIDADHHGL